MDVDTSQPAPIVNAELLSRYMGRKVRCVIKVLRAEAGTITGETSDGRQVTARQVPPPVDGEMHSYVEIIGIVEGDTSLRAQMCTNFGHAFDMAVYNQLCRLANIDHQDIFT